LRPTIVWGNDVTTAAEIRARVARADRDRIERRAKAAAAVAELAAHYERARTELVRTEQRLADAVTSALTVMTVQELGRFIRRRSREVDTWTTLGRDRPGSTAPPPKAENRSAAAAEQRPRPNRGRAAAATEDTAAEPAADVGADTVAVTPPAAAPRRAGGSTTPTAHPPGRPDAADGPSASTTSTAPATPASPA
jgi:hypothetical protein